MKFRNVDESKIWADIKFEMSLIKKQLAYFLESESQRLSSLKLLNDYQKAL